MVNKNLINRLSISFVIPCLNEESSLPFVLNKLRKTCNELLRDYKTEIIISDNGSTDHSLEIAKSYGVRIENCPIKGYGATLKYGISKANNDIIVFADADDTYDFLEAPLLIHEIEKGYDLVIGSRIKGKIYKGAMPFSHRYIGTPVLNNIINKLYNINEKKISDCNSGFRCFLKKSYESWDIQSDGMEFASEMLIKALKQNAKISEVPISLFPDLPERKPHLKTWRDGMRHLLQILVEAPFFFNNIGLITFGINAIILIICLIIPDYLHIFGISVFGIHTMMFAMLGSLFGQILWSIGLFISVKNNDVKGLYYIFINLSEDIVFLLIFGLAIFSLFCFGIIIVNWALNGFINLSLQKQTLFIISIAANGIIFLFNIFTTHLIKHSL